MGERSRRMGPWSNGALVLCWLGSAALPAGVWGQFPPQGQIQTPARPAAQAPAQAAVQIQAPAQGQAQAPGGGPAQTPTGAQQAPPAAAPSQETCLKNVFGLYCLGTDVNLLLRQRPPTDQARDGDRLALIYDQGQEQDYVLAYRGVIYKVVRQFRIETQLKFQDIYNQLREKYGTGEDRSLFPGYADNPASRQGSIRRGDGKAIYVWTPADTWRIELTWTREFGLALAYVDNELEAQQKAAVQRGL